MPEENEPGRTAWQQSGQALVLLCTHSSCASVSIRLSQDLTRFQIQHEEMQMPYKITVFSLHRLQGRFTDDLEGSFGLVVWFFLVKTHRGLYLEYIASVYCHWDEKI